MDISLLIILYYHLSVECIKACSTLWQSSSSPSHTIFSSFSSWKLSMWNIFQMIQFCLLMQHSRKRRRRGDKKREIEINLSNFFFLSWSVDLQFTELRKNPIYINSYICCQTFVMGEHTEQQKLVRTCKHFAGIFPTLTLGILNYKIMKAMKRATTRHNNISTVERR